MNKSKWLAVLVLSMAILATAQIAHRTQILTQENVAGFQINYLHDSDSGTEFICVKAHAERELHSQALSEVSDRAVATSVSESVSCFSTGRVWKK